MEQNIGKTANARRSNRIGAPLANLPQDPKFCVLPDVVPQAHKGRTPHQTKFPSTLLPGLPDDLAIACSIRVPCAEHNKFRLVCRRWFKLLAGDFFYTLRKSAGIVEEWVYVIKRDREGKMSWHTFDLTDRLWQTLPPIPQEYSSAL